jgi:hypothetical protein
MWHKNGADKCSVCFQDIKPQWQLKPNAGSTLMQLDVETLQDGTSCKLMKGWWMATNIKTTLQLVQNTGLCAV